MTPTTRIRFVLALSRTIRLGALLVFTACGDPQKNVGKEDTKDAAKPAADAEGAAKDETKKEPAQVSAGTDTVQVSAFNETLNAVGSVVARVGHIAMLSAPAPTRVTRLLVTVGDRVKKGAEVIELEQPSFDAALASAEAALAAAERAAERARRLVEAGVAPRKDADLAAADLAAARLNALNARRTRELSHLRSPINGAVTRLNTVLGASVDAGQPLIEIADPSMLDVVLHVSPSEADHVRIGASVTLHEQSGTNAPVVGAGRVADIGAVVDSASRGVAVRVMVTSSKRTLRLGEALAGDVAVAVHEKAVSVPDAALVPSGESYHVFVVDTASVAHVREVKIGGRAGGRVWISEGLAAGEVVVTTGAYGVDDGSRVLRAKP